MRILLDEELRRQLAAYFFGHDVRTTQEQGWAGLESKRWAAAGRSSTFAVAVVMIGTAMVAAAVPALRASRADALSALRG